MATLIALAAVLLKQQSSTKWNLKLRSERNYVVERPIAPRLDQPLSPVRPYLNATEEPTVPSAFSAVRTASRAVTQFYDLVLAPTGLKATQFVILQAIRSAGEIAQCDFAREFGIEVPTLSR